MLRIVADSLVTLPFKLHYCARKQNVDPLVCTVQGSDITLYFPPSMSAGTDGKGVFKEWAWWTGTTLRVIVEWDQADAEDTDSIRTRATELAEMVLRRFLNGYRLTFNAPEVHAVPLDPKAVTITAIHPDGTRTDIPEPMNAFFFQSMPDSAPLNKSVNETNWEQMLSFVQHGAPNDLKAHFRLDADLLRSFNELERADIMDQLEDVL